jgi:hypothetical protein
MSRSRARNGAFTGLLLSAGVLALSAPSCASATQIVVDVETEEVLCDSIVVGIAVGKPEEIDTKEIQVRQAGCIEGGVQVGSLTISPSGERDAVVGIRIVAGVNGAQPESCGRSDANGNVSWQNCILARRTVQFAPGQTTPLTVVLSADCVGQVCPGGNECNLGKCVAPSQVQNDGGNQPVKDGQAYADAASDTPFDVPPVDTGADACVFCKGGPGGPDCNGSTNTCNVDCNAVDCKDDVVCSGGLNCTINCLSAGKCNKTACDTTGTCAFTCSGPGAPRCTTIACHAFQCSVACDTGDTTCQHVVVEAGASNVSCGLAAGNKPTCDDVTCLGGSCLRTCGPNGFGCGLATSCTGECTQWQEGGVPVVDP